jgi:hypothetical protein
MTSKNWTEKLKSGQPMSNSNQSKELDCNGNNTVWRHFMRLSDCIVVLNDAPSERVSIVVECNIAELKHTFAVRSEEGKVGILYRNLFSPFHGVVFDKVCVMWNFVGLAENQ